MGISRSNRKRVAQVARWLREVFPTSKPVRVQWVAKVPCAPDAQVPASVRRDGDWADTTELDDCFVIRLSTRLHTNGSQAVDTLLHEWAHCDRRQSMKHPHGKAWGNRYWPIYERFYDRGGHLESMRY